MEHVFRSISIALSRLVHYHPGFSTTIHATVVDFSLSPQVSEGVHNIVVNLWFYFLLVLSDYGCLIILVLL